MEGRVEEIFVVDEDDDSLGAVPLASGSASSSVRPCLSTDYPFPSGTPLLVFEVCALAEAAVEAAKAKEGAGLEARLSQCVLCSVRVSGLLESVGEKALSGKELRALHLLRCAVNPKAFLLVCVEQVHPLPELHFLSKYQFIGELAVVPLDKSIVESLAAALEASASQQAVLVGERLPQTTLRKTFADARTFSGAEAVSSGVSQKASCLWVPLVRARVARHLPALDFELYSQSLKLLRQMEPHTTPEAVKASVLRKASGKSDASEEPLFAGEVQRHPKEGVS